MLHVKEVAMKVPCCPVCDVCKGKQGFFCVSGLVGAFGMARAMKCCLEGAVGLVGGIIWSCGADLC